MALGTATVVSTVHKSASAPLKVFFLSFAGDGAYPAGGTASFEAYVQAAVSETVDVLAVFRSGACGGYVPIYDKANDKLYVEQGDYSETADGPHVENGTADISGTTFTIGVICQ